MNSSRCQCKCLNKCIFCKADVPKKHHMKSNNKIFTMILNTKEKLVIKDKSKNQREVQRYLKCNCCMEMVSRSPICNHSDMKTKSTRSSKYCRCKCKCQFCVFCQSNIKKQNLEDARNKLINEERKGKHCCKYRCVCCFCDENVKKKRAEDNLSRTVKLSQDKYLSEIMSNLCHNSGVNVQSHFTGNHTTGIVIQNSP